MAVLYVDRRFAAMRQEGRRLVLESPGGETRRVPLALMERVVVLGNVQTDTGTLGALAEAGIPVALLSGRQFRRRATVMGIPGKDVRRRLGQYQAWLDLARRTELAACILVRKLVAQRRFLQAARRRRPDLRRPLTRALEVLEEIQRTAEGGSCDLDRLRGLEGAAARAYFAAYAGLFPSGLGFSGRKRRPPPDPVNALLSLGYTLLHAEAERAIHAAGLDPYLGYLHDPAHGRPSLASDLVEPLRARHDAFVWWIFRERHLRDRDFRQADGGCLLGRDARGRFYGLFEQRMPPVRRWLRQFVHRLTGRFPEVAT